MGKVIKKKLAWFKTPVGISIGTAVFSFMLTVGYDLFKDKPVLSTLCGIIFRAYNLVIMFLNFQLKVWWVLLGVILLVMLLFVIVRISEAKNSNTATPDFLNYTSDTISRWNWEWQWEKDYSGKYALVNLHPICPRCATPFVLDYSYSNNVKCPRCNYSEHNQMPDFDHIKVVIYDNVKRNLDRQNKPV